MHASGVQRSSVRCAAAHLAHAPVVPYPTGAWVQLGAYRWARGDRSPRERERDARCAVYRGGKGGLGGPHAWAVGSPHATQGESDAQSQGTAVC